MNDCITHEHLVSLVGVLGDATLPSAEHLAGCERCGRRLHELEALRAELAAEVPLRAGFVDSVMSGFEADPVVADSSVAGSRISSSERWAEAAAIALLVAGAVTMILTASSTAGQPAANVATAMSSSNVIMGVLAGVVTAIWESRGRRTAGGFELTAPRGS